VGDTSVPSVQFIEGFRFINSITSPPADAPRSVSVNFMYLVSIISNIRLYKSIVRESTGKVIKAKKIHYCITFTIKILYLKINSSAWSNNVLGEDFSVLVEQKAYLYFHSLLRV